MVLLMGCAPPELVKPERAGKYRPDVQTDSVTWEWDGWGGSTDSITVSAPGEMYYAEDHMHYCSSRGWTQLGGTID